jgi:hypothetical protein
VAGVTLDPESASLLVQAQNEAKRQGELAAKAATDGHRVDAEVSLSHQGGGWMARAWAKLTAKKDAKPDVSGGVEVSKRW